MVRGFMDDKERILLDWSGDIAEKYGFQDEIRVLHISGNGFIDCIAQENYTEKKLKQQKKNKLKNKKELKKEIVWLKQEKKN